MTTIISNTIKKTIDKVKPRSFVEAYTLIGAGLILAMGILGFIALATSGK